MASVTTISGSPPPTCSSGTSPASTERPTVRLEYRPRPEYGLVAPLLRRDGTGRFVSHGGPDRLTLWSSHQLDVMESAAVAVVHMKAGETLAFALGWSRSWETTPIPDAEFDPAARLEDTVAAWDSWAQLHQRYDGPWAKEVRFAGVVLQGLTFKPSAVSRPCCCTGCKRGPHHFSWGPLAMMGGGTSTARLRVGAFEPRRDCGDRIAQSRCYLPVQQAKTPVATV